jgi:gluconolactonase
MTLQDTSTGPDATRTLDRRRLLQGAATLAAGTMVASHALARDFGPNAEPQRYPDPDILVLDEKRFKAKVGNTTIKRLHTGCLWAEGPAWNTQGQYLVWSDIPSNRQLRYLDDDGHISEQFRKPSNESNGNSFDYEGRQITAERTRLVRFEHNGTTTVLAEQANGKPLNGPNDMVVHPADKAIWFTDPGYGAINLYEGQNAKNGSNQPFQKEAVYRLDAQTAR